MYFSIGRSVQEVGCRYGHKIRSYVYVSRCTYLRPFRSYEYIGRKYVLNLLKSSISIKAFYERWFKPLRKEKLDSIRWARGLLRNNPLPSESRKIAHLLSNFYTLPKKIPTYFRNTFSREKIAPLNSARIFFIFFYLVHELLGKSVSTTTVGAALSSFCP